MKNKGRAKHLWAVQYDSTVCDTNINLPLPKDMKRDLDILGMELNLPVVEIVRIAITALIAESRK